MREFCMFLTLSLVVIFTSVGQNVNPNNFSNREGNLVSINGNLYVDLDEDEKFSINDEPIEGIEVEAYIDINQNGIIDNEDEFAANSISNESGYYVLEVAPTFFNDFSTEISTSSDDAVEDAFGGYMNLDGHFEAGGTEIGLRFAGINIPNGAEILGASIEVKAASTNPFLSHLTVSGEESSNAPTFLVQNYNLSNRPRTNTSVIWQPNLGFEINSILEVEGVEEIIEEIISLDGWETGNALVFFLSDFDNQIYMFDGGFAPKLHITYRNPGQDEVQYLVQPVMSDALSEFNLVTDPIKAIRLTGNQLEVNEINFGFSQSIVLSDNPSSINEISLNVWPNPTTGPLNISLEGIQTKKEFEMSVFNVNGALMDTKTISFEYGSNLQYDLSNFSKGTYIIQMNNGDQLLSKKVILR